MFIWRTSRRSWTTLGLFRVPVSGLLYFMSDLRFLEKGADNAQRLDFKTGDRVRLNAAGLEVPEDDELRAMSCRQRVAAAHERGQLLPAARAKNGRKVEITASSQGHDRSEPGE